MTIRTIVNETKLWLDDIIEMKITSNILAHFSSHLSFDVSLLLEFNWMAGNQDNEI